MHKIKVLWIMNEPLPDCAIELNMPISNGGWLTALSQALVQTGMVELGVACRIPLNKSHDLKLGGIEYFTVPALNIGYKLLRPTTKMIQRYQEIVRKFSPDVIHVQGTEWYGGLVTAENRLDRPTIISLQGLIDYHRRFLLGNLGFWDILKCRTLKEWLFFRGLWEERLQWDKRAEVEREIVRGHNLYIGRTLWDRSHLRRMNPNATYFHCDEIVREEFFELKWDLSSAKRNTIFAPSASYPLKGFHVLVKAVTLLRDEFPDIRVHVPLATFVNRSGFNGLYSWLKRDGYSNYLVRLIKDLGLEKYIIPMGRLSGQEMAEEMQHSHVFVLSSFIENSSNAMAEALTIGIPSVVPLVGGIPSLIIDGQNALGYPRGDEAFLAEQIRRIFRDDNMANKLSRAGRKTAYARYSPELIVKRMVEIYETVVRGVHPEYLKMPPKPELEPG